MALVQAAILAITALILTPGLLFHFDVTPKAIVVLVGAAALLVCGRYPAGNRSFSWLLLAGAASLAISAAVSSRPARSLFGTNWRRFGVVEQAAILAFAW